MNRSPMRLCGKRYATEEEARTSKRGLQSGVVIEECRLAGCGGWHVRSAPSSRAPLKPATRPKPGSNSDIPDEVRRLVLERDGYRCVCCGRSIIGRRYSLGHRRRASQGGRPVPSNLIVLLGWGGEACHGRIDFYRDPEDAVKGYRVKSRQDPALIPVMIFKPHGPLETAWLTDSGEYSTKPPAKAVA